MMKRRAVLTALAAFCAAAALAGCVSTPRESSGKGFALTRVGDDTGKGAAEAAPPIPEPALSGASFTSAGLRGEGVDARPLAARLGEGDDWKHKRLALGARAGGAFHFYALNTQHDADVSSPFVFQAALTADVRLSPRISLGAETAYRLDYFRADSAFFSTEVRASSLVIPLFVKAVFMPRSYYVAGFAGPFIRIPLGQLALDSGGAAERYDASLTPGIVLGAEGGMPLGPGLIVLDLRYAQDMFFVKANGAKQYRAGSLEFSIGYKMSFLPLDY